jgi:hypothetical protein
VARMDVAIRPDIAIMAVSSSLSRKVLCADCSGGTRLWESPRRVGHGARLMQVLYDEFGMSSSRVAQQARPIIDGGDALAIWIEYKGANERADFAF